MKLNQQRYSEDQRTGGTAIRAYGLIFHVYMIVDGEGRFVGKTFVRWNREHDISIYGFDSTLSVVVGDRRLTKSFRKHHTAVRAALMVRADDYARRRQTSKDEETRNQWGAHEKDLHTRLVEKRGMDR